MKRLLKKGDVFRIDRQGQTYPYFTYKTEWKGKRVVRKLNQITLNSSTSVGWTEEQTRGEWTRRRDRLTDLSAAKAETATWRVEQIIFDGGGDDGYGGSYPNGHHVVAHNVKNPKQKLDFYQSGSFIPMIEKEHIVLAKEK